MVGMFLVGFIFLCSFDVTLIALADKVLVHLVLPRCKFVPFEFLYRKSTSHLSIHVELLLLLYDRNFAGCCYNNLPVLRERGLRHYTGGGDGVGSSYQAL